MNYVCWLCCVLDDRERLTPGTAEILDKPDLAVWDRATDSTIGAMGRSLDSRTVATLPIQGEEIAHLQAYSDGEAKSNSCSTIKPWSPAAPSPRPPSNSGISHEKRRCVSSSRPTRKATWPTSGCSTPGSYWARCLTEQTHRHGVFAPKLPQQPALHPANFFGRPFNLISDDGQSAAIFLQGRVMIASSRLQKQNAIAVPILKTGEASAPTANI